MNNILFSVVMMGAVVISSGCSVSNSSSKNTSHAVSIYKNQDELLGRSYEKLGPISGSSCQLTQQDRPATINDARSDLINRASHSNGNAILLGRCEIMSSSSGCYRLSVCEGTLLQIHIKSF